MKLSPKGSRRPRISAVSQWQTRNSWGKRETQAVAAVRLRNRDEATYRIKDEARAKNEAAPRDADARVNHR